MQAGKQTDNKPLINLMQILEPDKMQTKHTLMTYQNRN